MADKRLTDLDELLVPSFDDFMHVVDVSDVTDSTAGTSKKSTIDDIVTAVQAVTSPANEVVINQESDFVTQTASEIFLEDDKVYIAGASFTTTKRIQIGKNNQIIAYSPSVVWQTSDIILFQGTDVGSFKIDGLSVGFVGGSPLALFVFLDLAPLTSNIELNNITGIAETPASIISSAFVTCTNISSLIVENTRLVDGLGVQVGIQFTGSQGDSVFIEQSEILGESHLLFGNCVFNDRVRVDGLVCIGASGGAIGIASGLGSSGNIASGKLATFNHCEFISPITPLDQISETDIRYKFTDCFPIPDTTINFFSSIDSGETVSISGIASFEPIAGGNWSTTDTNKWSVDSDGVATFLSEIPTRVKIEANTSMTAGGDLIALRINIDTGSGFPATPPLRAESRNEDGKTANHSSSDIVFLNENDRVRMEVANLASTANINVNRAHFTGVVVV